MQNFTTLGQPILGEKYVTRKERRKEGKKEERKKNNAKNSGHYIPGAMPRAVHSLSSDQFLQTILASK